MTDSLLDDVKILLDRDFGDDRILRQICRACEHDEVISNYERNYVKELTAKYLKRQPESVSIPVATTHVTPDVILPIQQTQSGHRVPSRLKDKKIMLGVGGIFLAIIVTAAISLNATPDDVKINPPLLASLSIKTDLTSYTTKDLISISGISDTTDTLSVSITNRHGQSIWEENISPKNDGRFSTLTIAGGPGWEDSGTFIISVDNGSETKSDTFSFTT